MSELLKVAGNDRIHPVAIGVRANGFESAPWLSALYFLIVFGTPTFQGILGSSGSVLVNGTLLVVLVCWMVGMGGLRPMPPGAAGSYRFWSVLCALVLYTVWIPLAGLNGVAVGDVVLVRRDFFEIHRPVLHLLTFIFGFYLAGTAIGRQAVYRQARILLGVLVVFAIIALSGLGGEMLSLYTKGSNIQYRRVSAPFVNPYDFAFVMTFFFFICFAQICYARVNRFAWMFLALILLASILFTQSRSVLVGCIVGTVLGFPLVFMIRGMRHVTSLSISWPSVRFLLIVLLACVVVGVSLGWLSSQFPYIFQAVFAVLEGRSFGSARMRLEQIQLAIDLGRQDWRLLAFGMGPAKDMVEFLESAYAFYVFRYGVLGLLFFFWLPWLIGLISISKLLRQSGFDKTWLPVFAGAWVWWLMVPLSSFGNNFTEQVRVSAFYFAMLGFFIGCAGALNGGALRGGVFMQGNTGFR